MKLASKLPSHLILLPQDIYSSWNLWARRGLRPETWNGVPRHVTPLISDGLIKDPYLSSSFETLDLREFIKGWAAGTYFMVVGVL